MSDDNNETVVWLQVTLPAGWEDELIGAVDNIADGLHAALHAIDSNAGVEVLNTSEVRERVER